MDTFERVTEQLVAHRSISALIRLVLLLAAHDAVDCSQILTARLKFPRTFGNAIETLAEVIRSRRLAAAVVSAIAASLVLAITLVPVVAAIFLRPKKGVEEEDVWIVRKLKAVYAPLLDYALRHRVKVLIGAAVITIPALILALYVGSDFMPKLKRAQELMRGIRGIEDLRVEKLTGMPQLKVSIDRQAVARVGLTPGDVIRAIRIGMAGEEESEVWIGQRRFDMIVRLQDETEIVQSRSARC